MNDRFIIFDEQFRKDLSYWFRKDKAKAFKVLDLVEAITKDPFQGIGKPERLKYIDSDTRSRRIDLEHRLIYKIYSDRIEFLQARYHY